MSRSKADKEFRKKYKAKWDLDDTLLHTALMCLAVVLTIEIWLWF